MAVKTENVGTPLPSPYTTTAASQFTDKSSLEEQLGQELIILMQLDHPNVVRVHGGCLVRASAAATAAAAAAGPTAADAGRSGMAATSAAAAASKRFIVEELCLCSLDQYLYKIRSSPLPLLEVLRVSSSTSSLMKCTDDLLLFALVLGEV